MANVGSSGTFVYVDGQNLKGSAVNFFDRKAMDANLPRLLQAIVATQNNASMEQARYYTGLPTKADPVRRAESIAMLDRIQAQGIQTFANDIQRNAAGQFKEVGIDLKLAADMVSDFLLHPKATTFMVVSNDRDYEPVFALMRDLAKFTKREIDLVSVVAGHQRAVAGARPVELTKAMFERFVPESDGSRQSQETREDFRKIAVERIAQDQQSALDASAHAGRTKIPVVTRTAPLVRGSGIYIDANSMGATAKRAFGRTHLDMDIPKFMVSFVRESGRKPRLARAYMSQHSREHDLVDNVMVEGLATDLKARGIEAQTFAYSYQHAKIGFDQTGPGGGTPVHAVVANEKRNTTQILSDVVKDILSGRVDDIVLVSDDKSLWPIAELAQQIGRFSKQEIEVRNVHLDDHAVERTNGIRVDQDTYAQFVGEKDRLQAAVAHVQEIKAGELAGIETEVKKRFGSDVKIAVNPTSIDGTLLGKTKHWLVFDEGKSVAVAERGQINAQSGVRYVLQDSAIQQQSPAIGPVRSIQKDAVRSMPAPNQAERSGRSA